MNISNRGGRAKAAPPAYVILACAPLVAALILSLSYWPGLVTYDSVRQFDQALSGAFDDWHPPIMGWLWQRFLIFGQTPAPMLLLQLGLYAAGFLMLIRWACRAGRGGMALLIGLCAALPLSSALMGEVLKDCLMAGALVCAAGLLALSQPRGRPFMRLAVAALVIFAAALRFNAFLAGVPLLLALLPRGWLRTWPRMALCAAAASLLLLAALPVANRLIGAEKSGVELSLVIFDLGGISEHSGVNVFPPIGIANPLAVNHRCYTPVKWDSYSWWVDPLCPIGFERVRHWFRASGVNPYVYLLGQVAHHPIAYLQHRLAHWRINARFFVPAEVERPVQLDSAPNPWRFRVTPSPLVAFADVAALASAKTPLGLPWCWMSLAFVTLLVARRRAIAAVAVPLAASALLYGLGYGLFSVASELRYYLWTMVAAAIAAAITLTDVIRPGRGT